MARGLAKAISVLLLLLLAACLSAEGAASHAPPAPPASGGGGGADSLPCIQKLVPCQPYLHSPSPPATCCGPLREMLKSETNCLCTVFNNPAMLKSLNLTKENALDLPKACGSHADISICKNEKAPPTGSPSTPAAPPAGNGTSGDSSAKSPPKSAARGTAGLAGSSLAATLFIFFIVSIII